MHSLLKMLCFSNCNNYWAILVQLILCVSVPPILTACLCKPATYNQTNTNVRDFRWICHVQLVRPLWRIVSWHRTVPAPPLGNIAPALTEREREREGEGGESGQQVQTNTTDVWNKIPKTLMHMSILWFLKHARRNVVIWFIFVYLFCHQRTAISMWLWITTSVHYLVSVITAVVWLYNVYDLLRLLSTEYLYLVVWLIVLFTMFVLEPQFKSKKIGFGFVLNVFPYSRAQCVIKSWGNSINFVMKVDLENCTQYCSWLKCLLLCRSVCVCVFYLPSHPEI